MWSMAVLHARHYHSIEIDLQYLWAAPSQHFHRRPRSTLRLDRTHSTHDTTCLHIGKSFVSERNVGSTTDHYTPNYPVAADLQKEPIDSDDDSRNHLLLNLEPPELCDRNLLGDEASYPCNNLFPLLFVDCLNAVGESNVFCSTHYENSVRSN